MFPTCDSLTIHDYEQHEEEKDDEADQANENVRGRGEEGKQRDEGEDRHNSPLMIRNAFLPILDPQSAITSFTFVTSYGPCIVRRRRGPPKWYLPLHIDLPHEGSHQHEIDRLRQEIVNIVLSNKSLLDVELYVSHGQRGIPTDTDRAVIQQHIQQHRDTLRKGIDSITWVSSENNGKEERMLDDCADIVYEYMTPSRYYDEEPFDV